MPGVEPCLAAKIEALDGAEVTVARAWLTTAGKLAGWGSDPVQSATALPHPSTLQRAFPDTVFKTPTTVHGAGPILGGFTRSPELPRTHRTRYVILSPQRPTRAKKANRCKEGQLISRTTKPKGATGGLRVSPPFRGDVSEGGLGLPRSCYLGWLPLRDSWWRGG